MAGAQRWWRTLADKMTATDHRLADCDRPPPSLPGRPCRSNMDVHRRMPAGLYSGAPGGRGTVTMKCVLGRHDWRPGVNVEGQAYEKCEKCGHYRYPDSDGGRFERHGELPMDNQPGGGLFEATSTRWLGWDVVPFLRARSASDR